MNIPTKIFNAKYFHTKISRSTVCGPACAIKQLESTERVASVEETLIHLSSEQHCGRLNCSISFTTDVYQVTPGPQWLCASRQVDTEIPCSKQVGQGAAFTPWCRLVNWQYLVVRFDLKHAVHLPRISISVDRKCYFSFVFLFSLLGVLA